MVKPKPEPLVEATRTTALEFAKAASPDGDPFEYERFRAAMRAAKGLDEVRYNRSRTFFDGLADLRRKSSY